MRNEGNRRSAQQYYYAAVRRQRRQWKCDPDLGGQPPTTTVIISAQGVGRNKQMGIVHSNVSIALDGINNFTDGDETFHWDNGFIGNVDIFTPDTTPALITVTASFSGHWNMGRFSIGGETGSNIRAIVTDVATEHRYMDDMNLYGTGGNNVTLLHTDVQNFGGSEAADTLTVDSAVWMGAAQMFGGDDTVTVKGEAQIEVVNLGRGNNTLIIADNGQVGVVQAYDGNDSVSVNSSSGPDTVSLGSGDNTFASTGGFVSALTAYGGNDTAIIGADTGAVNLGNGNNTIITGAGSVDSIVAYGGADRVTLGSGNTGTIMVGGGNNIVTTGGGGVAAIITFQGNDHVTIGSGGVGSIDVGDGNNVVTLLKGVGGANAIRGGSGRDVYNVSSHRPLIADDGGFDTITTTLSWDLGDGRYPSIEKLTLLGGAAINGHGNALNNVIAGNNAANNLNGGRGADTLFGLGGNDTLIGGLGKDLMAGGFGNDSFRFTSVAESPRGAGADLITDFDDFGNDRIDLRDVFGGTLQYIHNAAFSAAGQVRINDVAGPDVVVQVNTFGTSVAEMEIRLSHTTLGSMNAGDFFL